MYFGRIHTATVQGLEYRPFHCAKCGLDSVVEVKTTGYGSAQSPLLLREKQAKNDASAEAALRATQNTERLASWATCVRCGFRNDEVVSSFKRSKAMNGLGIGALASGILWVLFGFNRPAFLHPAVIAGAGLFVAFVVFQQHAWLWLELDDRVRVLTRDEADHLAAAQRGATN